MRADEFWSLTPHETRAFVMAHGERQMRAYKRSMWAAWHTAAFSRQKRLPSLDRIMRKLDGKPAKQQSPQEMLRMVETLNAAFGGKDKRAKS